MNILVLCTGNSARSILLEALLNRADRISAFSAGSQPAGRVHPGALRLLARDGFPTAGLPSKSWDEFASGPPMDTVITVCGNAAQEVCPIWPGAPVKGHWGVDDPAIDGSDDQVDAAFSMAYKILQTRADAFINALPWTMNIDDMKNLVHKIGGDNQ